MKKQIYWEDIEIGMGIPSLDKIPTTMMLVKWAAAYGDFNPLHYDDKFAINLMNTSGVIVHGTLKRQWLIQMLTDWIGDSGWLKSIQTQFRAMDYPRIMKTMLTPVEGETLICKGSVTAKSEINHEHLVECEIKLLNGKGEITTSGKAVVVFANQELASIYLGIKKQVFKDLLFIS